MSYIRELRQRLRLDPWFISLSEEFDESYGEEAYLCRRDDERTATIHIDPSVTDYHRVRFLVAHEMVHILLSDLEFIACNGRSTDIMDIFNRELEQVVNAIANMLVEP